MNIRGRKFDVVSINAEAGRRCVHRITCSECGAHGDISASGPRGRLPPDLLVKNWHRSGWTIGKHDGEDLCPTCSSEKRRARKMLDARVANIEDQKERMTMTNTKQPAEAPRQPNFDEKRIIFTKLEEIYIDERTGYSGNWTDQKVADDLGIPRKWVEDMREANFGPVGNNEEARKAMDELGKLRVELSGLVADFATKAKGIQSRIDGVEKSLR